MGYDPCFGLIGVDMETQERTWKESAYWYQRVIERNGFDLSEIPAEPSYQKAPAIENRVSA